MCEDFWIEFDQPPPETTPFDFSSRGFGVTAIDLADALRVLKEHVFGSKALPPARRVIEDVDVSTP